MIDSGLSWDEERLEAVDEIKKIIIHHTAGSGGETVKDIHAFHQRRGWVGIGYHYFIDSSGKIFRGRPDTAVGAHAYGYNSESLGVCLAGNFCESVPSVGQLRSLIYLTADLCARSWIDVDCVFGHGFIPGGERDTECPGSNMMAVMPLIRDRVAAILRSEEFERLSAVSAVSEIAAIAASDLQFYQQFDNDLFGQLAEAINFLQEDKPIMANGSKTTLFGKPVDESKCVVVAEPDEAEETAVITAKEAGKRVKKNGGYLLQLKP